MTTEEIFVPIIGYENYEIGNRGTIRMLTYATSQGLRPRKEPMVKKSRLDKFGKLYTNLSKKNRSKKFMVHRLVAAHFIGMPKGTQIVRHLDGDALNNSADNLAFGTQRENIEDARRHGTLKMNAVIGFSGDGTFVIFDSAAESMSAGFGPSSICAVIAGRQNSHRGYQWRRLNKESFYAALRAAIADWVKSELKDYMYGNGSEDVQDFLQRRTDELRNKP